jgi:ribonuclease BN (tRNA processing enzyme)
VRVYTLGAGTPTPTPTRFGSSYVVDIGGDKLMFDCGPAATDKLVKAGLRPTDIDHLFFTHHHFDHDADYPCFLLCRWDEGADAVPDLQVFGPSPTRLITDRLIGEDGAFIFDVRARVNHPMSQRLHVSRGGRMPRRPPVPAVQDIGPGVVHQTTSWRVTAAVAEHVQPWLDSLAYRLDSEEGSIVITGDTGPCDSVRDLARGADTLLCLCWDDQATLEANGPVDGTCGTEDAASLAKAAGVRRLVVVHTGPSFDRPGATERAIADMARIYDGEIVWAQELMSYPASR